MYCFTSKLSKSFKSLSPIYFVNILPPDFLCNEFLIKMYRLTKLHLRLLYPFKDNEYML